MQSLLKLYALTAIFIAALTVFPTPGLADKNELKPVTTRDGKPPATALVEQPHQALRLWSREGQRHRTLVLISEEPPGITAVDKANEARINELLAKDDWDGLLSKDYLTAAPYPVNRRNYLYVAHEAGIVDSVYWVPPTKVSVGSEPLDKFKDYLSGIGVPKSDLKNIRKTKKSISGRINGIPVYIFSLGDLPKIKEDALLLIDLSFFPPLYKDEVKTPLLDLFGGFINTLGAKGMPVSGAVVSCSTALGPVPLEYRFLGGYLRTFLTEPGKLKDGPPPTWTLRSQAMYSETFFQTEEVLKAYVDAVKLDPDDASLRYALANAFFINKDLEGVRKEMAQAVALDKGYYPAYVEFAGYFQSNNMDKDAEYFFLRAAEANPADSGVLDGLHVIYFKSGRYKEAAEALERKAALGFNGADLFWELADTYMKEGLYGKASRTFLDALARIPELDRAARFPLLLALADSYEKDRQIDKALQVYEDVLKTADDPHSRQQVQERVERLKKEWAPFIGTSSQKPR